ncbi:MAG: hypothetical protein PHW24_01775 [Candidatus Moranbacteria bacterium]|nr:hypothetical protein [Candidatus Moranbacteria bacterium]
MPLNIRPDYCYTKQAVTNKLQKTKMKENLKTFGELMKKRTVQVQKAPAYQWQELALTIIKDLDIPNNKRSSVFMVCKKHSRQIIERAFNDTKELCKSGEKWRYFFKLIEKKPDNKPIS